MESFILWKGKKACLWRGEKGMFEERWKGMFVGRWKGYVCAYSQCKSIAYMGGVYGILIM
jgi:hypothetical protein